MGRLSMGSLSTGIQVRRMGQVRIHANMVGDRVITRDDAMKIVAEFIRGKRGQTTQFGDLEEGLSRGTIAERLRPVRDGLSM